MITEQDYREICQTIRKLVANGYEVMLFHQGLGETAVFLQVLYKYKEKTNKKLFVITYDPSRTELLKYSSQIDEVLEIPKDLYMLLCNDETFRQSCNIKDFLTFRQLKIDRSTIKTEICDYLGISSDTPYQKYVFPAVDANWDEYFAAKELIPGRTAYIVPHTVFLGKVVGDDFWEKLVVRLKNAGYTVLMNMPKETIPGIPFAYFDMSVSIHLAEKCGLVIGARTGFLDLVAAFTDLKLMAIYPDDSHPSWDICKGDLWKNEVVTGNYAQKYIESVGLQILFPRPGIEEFIYTNDEEILENILARI